MTYAYREIAPGVWVSNDTKVSIAHPDQSWLVATEKQEVISDGRGKVPIFTSEQAATTFIEKTALKDVRPFGPYGWDELVDMLSDHNHSAIVDHRGEPGFYLHSPLQKGI